MAWNEVKNQCEAWYEFLAAWLFSTNPTVKAYELGDYARLCITKMNMTSRMRYLDQVLLAAMELNIIQVRNVDYYHCTRIFHDFFLGVQRDSVHV